MDFMKLSQPSGNKCSSSGYFEERISHFIRSNHTIQNALLCDGQKKVLHLTREEIPFCRRLWSANETKRQIRFIPNYHGRVIAKKGHYRCMVPCLRMAWPMKILWNLGQGRKTGAMGCRFSDFGYNEKNTVRWPMPAFVLQEDDLCLNELRLKPFDGFENDFGKKIGVEFIQDD